MRPSNLALTLESTETPRFACRLPFGSTNVPSQVEEHSGRNLLNGQVLDISERFEAGIGYVEVLEVSGFVPTGHRNTIAPEPFTRNLPPGSTGRKRSLSFSLPC